MIKISRYLSFLGSDGIDNGWVSEAAILHPPLLAEDLMVRFLFFFARDIVSPGQYPA